MRNQDSSKREFLMKKKMLSVLSIVLVISATLSILMSDFASAAPFVQPERITSTGPTLRSGYPAVVIDDNKVIHFAHTWMPYDEDTELPFSDVYYGNNLMTGGWGLPVYEGEKLQLDNASYIGYDLEYTRRLAIDVDNKGSAAVAYQARRENQYNDAIWTAFINVSANNFTHHETSAVASNRFSDSKGIAVDAYGDYTYSGDNEGRIWIYNTSASHELFPSNIINFNISANQILDSDYNPATNKIYFAAGFAGVLITDWSAPDAYNKRWIYRVAQSEVLSIARVGNYLYGGLANGNFCVIPLDSGTGLPNGYPTYKSVHGIVQPIKKVYYDNYNGYTRVWFLKTNDFELWNVTVNNPNVDTFYLNRSSGIYSLSNLTSIAYWGLDGPASVYAIGDGDRLVLMNVRTTIDHTTTIISQFVHGGLGTTRSMTLQGSIFYTVYRDYVNPGNNRVYVWNATSNSLLHIRNQTLTNPKNLVNDQNGVISVIADNQIYSSSNQFVGFNTTANGFGTAMTGLYAGAANRLIAVYADRYAVFSATDGNAGISQYELVNFQITSVHRPSTGNYLYFSTNRGVGTIDVSTPMNPMLAYYKRVNSAHTDGYQQRTILKRPSSNYGYVTDSNFGVRAIDFTTPNNPIWTVYTAAPSYPINGEDIALIQTNYAIVTNTSHYVIFNIAGPTPTQTYVYTLANVNGVFVSGNNVYFGTSAGLYIYDLSNLASPNLLGSKAIYGTSRKLRVVGNYAYVTCTNFGLAILDVSVPASPGDPIYKRSSSARAVAVKSGFAYVADNTDGTIIIDVSDPSSLVGLINYDPDIKFYRNSTALVVWASDNAILGRYHYPNGSSSSIFSIVRQMFTKELALGIGYDGTNIYTHLAYVRNDGSRERIYYTQQVNNGTWSAPTTIDGTGSFNCNEVKIDVKGPYVSVAFTHNENIRASLSINNGASFSYLSVTNDAIKDMMPDVYVSSSGYTEIVYSKFTASNRYILVSRHNYYTADFLTATENHFLEKRNPALEYNYTNVAIAENNGTVSVIYEEMEYEGFWKKSEVYLFSWQNMFYDGVSNFRWFNQYDDPGGKFLIEGMQISANTSGVSWPLTFEFHDLKTNNTWSASITIPSNGTFKQDIKWQRSEYFISDGNYTMTVYNGSVTGKRLLQIGINNYIYSQTPLNITVNGTEGNGSALMPYLIDFQIIFEYSNFLIVDANKLENEKNPLYGTLSSSNYADIKFFKLDAGQLYNFTLQDTNPTYAAELLIFDDNVQITNNSLSLLRVNTTVGDQGWGLYKANRTGWYYVLLRHYSGSEGYSVGYRFSFSANPAKLDLVSPANGQFINLNNASLGYEPVLLRWSRSSRDVDISHYQYQVFNDPSMNPANLTHSGNVSGMLNVNVSISLSVEQRYYWRVRAVDQGGNVGEWSAVNQINFDRTNPQAPTIFPLLDSYTNDSFIMQWSPSFDGIYQVSHYNIYYSRDPNFVPGPENLYRANVVQTFVDIRNLRNYRYFFKIQAVDNVGRLSPFSNIVDTTIVKGGFINPFGQYFGVEVGDVLEYEVTFVEGSLKNTFNEPMMEFYYRYYSSGTIFHFWIKTVNTEEPQPIRADFYANGFNRSVSGWVFIDYDISLSNFILSKNETYQQLVLNLTSKNLVGDALYNQFLITKYYTNWRDGTDARDVVCYIYYTTPGKEQSSINYIIDRSSGILLEMVYYNAQSKSGYNLKIVSTSVQMTQSDWVYIPSLWPIVIFATVGLIQLIIKKREFL